MSRKCMIYPSGFPLFFTGFSFLLFRSFISSCSSLHAYMYHELVLSFCICNLFNTPLLLQKWFWVYVLCLNCIHKKDQGNLNKPTSCEVLLLNGCNLRYLSNRHWEVEVLASVLYLNEFKKLYSLIRMWKTVGGTVRSENYKYI